MRPLEWFETGEINTFLIRSKKALEKFKNIPELFNMQLLQISMQEILPGYSP